MTLRRHITWHTDRTAGCRVRKIHPTSIHCRITFWQFLQGIQYVLLRRRQPHSGHLCWIKDDEKRQGKWWSFHYGWGDLIKYLVCEKKTAHENTGRMCICRNVSWSIISQAAVMRSGGWLGRVDCGQLFHLGSIRLDFQVEDRSWEHRHCHYGDGADGPSPEEWEAHTHGHTCAASNDITVGQFKREKLTMMSRAFFFMLS